MILMDATSIIVLQRVRVPRLEGVPACAVEARREPLALGGYGYVTANAGGDLVRAAAHAQR
jgi:hypothetical protein